MTIALGLLAADGIVIAADQQETSGSTKSLADKVLSVVAKHGVIAVTGAGAAGHLDAMAQQVTKAFIECKPGQERKAIRQSFDTFYSKHIVPLYPFYERFPDCDIEAIIGVDTPRERFIWANHLTALWEAGRYVVAGSGATQAALVLDRYFIPDLPLERAALLAGYAIYRVKESVEGCGKNTDVYMLRGGSCYRFWHWDQEELDRQFKQYDGSEMVLLHHVLGSNVPVSNPLPAIEMTRNAIANAVAKPRVFALPATKSRRQRSPVKRSRKSPERRRIVRKP